MTLSSPMQSAIEEARKSDARGEVPVGAVVIYQNQIIGLSGNRTIELNDPTAHAELLAIRMACAALKTQRLADCDLYVTLEPCPMCAQAISFARIRRLYFGAYDEKGGGVENGPRIFSQSSCHHKPEIYGGIAEHQCAEMLKGFFRRKR